MEFSLDDVAAADLSAILELNESEVPHVGEVDLARMQWFADNADWFRVAKAGERVAGFLIGLRPGSRYNSPNYRWFCERYDDFGYVDRVAVAAAFRRRGLASRLYEDFARSLSGSVRLMTCEVNIEPPNIDSMRFHTRLGFEQVGTLASADGRKSVAMLARPL